MRVKLHFAVGFHHHMIGIPAQVVARQIDQHHVFRIFFGVFAQLLRQFAILVVVAGAFKCSGNGMNVGFVVLNAYFGFGTGTENPVTAIVEIKQIRRRINGTQRAIDIKIIAFELLRKLSA